MFDWKLYEPKFDYKSTFDDHDTPWVGHTFFAYDLVRNLQPKKLVELGTFKGTSFYSFAQAAKDANLDTELFAVDTWEGDPQAGLLYGDKTYHFVIDNLRTHYIKLNTRLLRMTFAKAAKEFEANSIDVLHIDGLHTYEAVNEDYQTWKNKVKDSGVIIFHDIKVADFGVWKVWEQAKKDNKDGSFLEFEHNFGLGVLFKKNCAIQFDNKSLVNTIIAYYKNQAANQNLLIQTKELEEKLVNLDNKIVSQRDELKVLSEANNSLTSSLNMIHNSRPYKLLKAIKVL